MSLSKHSKNSVFWFSNKFRQSWTERKSWDSCTVRTLFNTREIVPRALLALYVPTPSPYPTDSCWNRQGIIPLIFQHCIGWGGGRAHRFVKRQHCFLRQNLWFAQNWSYVLTIPRTFVHDCSCSNTVFGTWYAPPGYFSWTLPSQVFSCLSNLDDFFQYLPQREQQRDLEYRARSLIYEKWFSY